MTQGLYLRATKTKNGITTYDSGLVEAHSWVRNHYVFMFTNVAGYPDNSADNLAMVDVDNTSRTTAGYVPITDNTSCWIGGSGDVTQGIVVGTDTTAVSFTDYNLIVPVAHGAGAGQLVFNPQEACTVAGDKVITHTRTFTNQSGNTVTVAEVGIRINLCYNINGATPNYDFLLCRDVLSPTVGVDDLETLQVQYVITVNFP